ncbi:hypothetical protein AB4874_19600 [Thioclava sp. 15-R06ZXC-3]|uniref:Restriction endonuclease n=1 Tax=Thioclava arctica TaxID=3238301 RepID=A0ABV3TRG1_9RHOB
MTDSVLEAVSLPTEELGLLQSCVLGDLLRQPKPLTGVARMRLSDRLATQATHQLLNALLGRVHKVSDANDIRRNQPGYDFIVDDHFRVQVKAGCYVESFGWAHKVGGSGADLDFDFLLGVDLGVMLNGRQGRLARVDIPVKPFPDFYCIPGATVREWVDLGRRVNARGNHIYLYKRPINLETKEAQRQTLELADYLGRFDLLSAAISGAVPLETSHRD